MHDTELLYRPVNLSVDNAVHFREGSVDSCRIVSGHYFDYAGFQTKWEDIVEQIFSFDNSGSNVEFQVL